MSNQPASDDGLSILEHLNELRVRLTWAAVSLAIGTAVSLLFTRQILLFLTAYYPDELQVISPTEGLSTYFKVALVSGAVLSMPLILYQLWLFIEPALERQEKRYVYIFVPSATLLFLLGIAFAWAVLMPSATLFLRTFLDEVFRAEWTSREYIGFVTTFLFWMGVSFEMPLIIYLLARLGVLSARTLREQWRLAIVAVAVIAAAITPSVDPITMLLTMAPLVILYGLSILLARLGQRQFERAYEL